MKKESLHKFRIEANREWKEDNFSLSGLTKYVQGNTNKNLKIIFEKTGLNSEMVTVDWILKTAKAETLLTKSGEKRKLFSLWFVSGLILNFAAEINAKAQISNTVVITEKKAEKTEIEATKANRAA